MAAHHLHESSARKSLHPVPIPLHARREDGSTYRRSNVLAGTRSKPVELFFDAAAMDLWHWASWRGRWPCSAGASSFSRRDLRIDRLCSPCRRHHSHRENEAGTAAWTATATAMAAAKLHCCPCSTPFYTRPPTSRVEGVRSVSMMGVRSLPTHPRFLHCR